MRTSVIASVMLVGLLAVGLRMQHRGMMAPPAARAAEPPTPRSGPRPPPPAAPAAPTRSTASAALWKQEVTGDLHPAGTDAASRQAAIKAARTSALRAVGQKLAEFMRERHPGYRY